VLEVIAVEVHIRIDENENFAGSGTGAQIPRSRRTSVILADQAHREFLDDLNSPIR